MFGHDERLRLGQIKHLTGAIANARFRIEAHAARRTGWRIMIDDFVGINDLSQGLAFVTLLSTRFLAGPFAQTRHPRRLLQPIARRRLAAVRTVQSEPTLKFGDMGSQRRNQRNEFFSRWLCLRFGIHRILESKSDSAVEKILHGCLREKMQPNLASYVFLSVRPIVLSLARSTMCSSTTFSSSRRRLQRANPSAAGERVSAINFASAAPSKIRGRAELGLYLRLNTASNPSSTSWRLVRSIVAMLMSSAAAIRLSLQPSPRSDTSAFSRMRAFVSSWAERLPLRINSSSWARSSALNRTTYFLTAISFPTTNHLHRCLVATEIQKLPSFSILSRGSR